MNIDYLYKCKNGNYLLKIFTGNIRVRETKDDILIPEYPEIYKFIINQYNYYGEVYNANLSNVPFLNDILIFSDIHIYGYDILKHPKLKKFLNVLKEKKCHIILHIQDFQIDEQFNALYKAKLFDELYINVNNINLKLLNNIKTLLMPIKLEVIIEQFTLNKLLKIKDVNILFKSCCNHKKSFKFLRGKVCKNIKYCMDNFSNVSFDINCINHFYLKKYFNTSNEYFLCNNNFFTIIFDLINNSYFKSFHSRTKFKIEPDLKKMFENLKTF